MNIDACLDERVEYGFEACLNSPAECSPVLLQEGRKRSQVCNMSKEQF